MKAICILAFFLTVGKLPKYTKLSNVQQRWHNTQPTKPICGLAGVVQSQYASIADAIDKLPELSTLRQYVKGNPLLATKIKATVFAPTNEVRIMEADNWDKAGAQGEVLSQEFTSSVIVLWQQLGTICRP